MYFGQEKSGSDEDSRSRRLKQLAWVVAIALFVTALIVGFWSGQFVSEDQQLGSPFLFRTLG